MQRCRKNEAKNQDEKEQIEVESRMIQKLKQAKTIKELFYKQ